MNTVGFIFDLDGVIVDTAKYHFLAWKNLANSLGIDFSKEQNEQLKGVSRIRSLEKILGWGNKTISQEKFEALLDEKNEEYLRYIESMDESEILPDVPRILNLLLENNSPIALGSASKNARAILKKVDLIDKFNAIVDGNDVTKAKPDPEVFTNAAEKIKVIPNKCVVFEDSVAGIQAAKKANMLAIGIGEKDILHEADHIFKSFEEISSEFITKLMKN